MPRFSDETRMEFTALYADYSDRIYRFCYHLCGQAAEAEDLTQDVFVAAYRFLPLFEGRSSICTWLYKIAHNRWKHLCSRKRIMVADIEQADQIAAPGADPAETGITRVALHQALSLLPLTLREALLLVKVEGLTYREAAAVLGVPQGTLQYRVHDAVQRLQQILEESGWIHRPTAQGALSYQEKDTHAL